MDCEGIKNIDWSDSEDSNDILGQSEEIRCSFCYKIFSNQFQITEHEKTCDSAINCTARKVTCKDGSMKFICDICCRTYKYAKSLTEHEKRHKLPGGFKCKYCQKRFCSEIQLEQHTEEFHKVYKCQICKQTFEIADAYIEHIKITHNGQDKLYNVCEDCGRQFSSLHIFKFHKETKCGTLRPYNCGKCEKTFKTKYLLKAHDLLHLEGKQYCCSFCGNKFATKAALQRHERRHTGEKPFKCHVCGKSFAYGESLVTHSSVHTGIKPYLCECCGSRFSCTGNLLAHRRKRLDTCGQPQYCTKLAKACPRPSIKSNEPPKPIIIKAHKVLKDEDSIKLETNKISHETYQNQIEEKSYKCHVCDETFVNEENLVTHSSVHTGIKPYLCECCGTRFACTDHLLAHRRRRLDTCGQPQYCTNITNDCPRPSIKSNKSSKSPNNKVLKDVNKKTNRIRKNKRLKSEENNKIKLKYEDEDELPLAVVKKIFDTEITNNEIFLNIPDIKMENEIISVTESANFNNEQTIKDNLKVEILEYELTPNINLKDDSADLSLPCEFNNKDLSNDSTYNLSTDNVILHNNKTDDDDINKFQKLMLNKVKSLQNYNDDEKPQNFTCHICNKTYKFFKSFQSHLKLHEYFNTKKKINDNKANTEFDKTLSNPSNFQDNLIKNEDDNICDDVKSEQQNIISNSLENNQLKEENNYDIENTKLDEDKQPLIQEKFECSECRNKLFRRKQSFIRHLRNIHKKTSTEIWKILLVNSDNEDSAAADVNSSNLQCKICGKSYSFVKSLQKHIQVHGPDGSLIHICRCCNKYFATKDEVHTHTILEHKEQITCTICNKIYKDPELLQAHRLYSHSNDPNSKPKKYTFICIKCGRSFTSRTAFTNHELSDCGKSPIHTCNVCGKGLHSAGSLKSHMLVHSGELEFTCKFCAKGFARKGQCQIHERKHTGEKPFPCTYCDKAFAYRENLLIHISTHTGLKRYMCNSCGERFSCVTGLKAHWRTHASTCGTDPNRSTKATGIYLGFQKGQLVHTKEPTESTE